MNFNSYFQFFGHHLVNYLRKFNRNKLQPTSHFFTQLLENDRVSFDATLKKMSNKKKKIDQIMVRYNDAVNLQGCKETIGMP